MKTAIQEFLEELSSDSEGVRSLIRELTGLVSYYERLLERFELDSLTGLPGSNKYHEFRDNLEIRVPASIGIIVFDVNDLKYYNDTKGHQAGDLLIQKAAESFHYISSQNVKIFRAGGDEFVAIITGCAESDIDGVVAKWQARLAELNTAEDGICCTIAWGAAFGSGQYKLGDVMQLADKRMYEEKLRMKECGLKIGEMR
ncbi:MAG: GGDEF domain-containing protein [Chitinispirillales bacterium]|jgi:diguanylate cyclase (GGDEF)-like protein|nr:GGDEF domain-containing protein [Chitinispirillales bacterium]